MGYEVLLTHPAKVQLDHIIDYLLFELENAQAALSVMEDAEAARIRLSHMAGSLKLCDDPVLRDLGYRMIHFKHHRYFLLYRIENDKVYIDAIYHDTQDYENVLKYPLDHDQ